MLIHYCRDYKNGYGDRHNRLRGSAVSTKTAMIDDSKGVHDRLRQLLRKFVNFDFIFA